MPVAAPISPGSRNFAPTEHLAAEAIAAFVDGELAASAQMRATQHLAMCTECNAAVDAQVAARSRLRESGQISMPSGLLGQLSEIPTREIDLNDLDFPPAQQPSVRSPDHPSNQSRRSQRQPAPSSPPSPSVQPRTEAPRQLAQPQPRSQSMPGAAPFPISSASRNPLNRWWGR